MVVLVVQDGLVLVETGVLEVSQEQPVILGRPDQRGVQVRKTFHTL